MAAIRGLPALALLCAALSACTSSSPGPAVSSAPPSAHAGLGGPSFTVTDVSEVIFQTPSKNIFCALTDSVARCDIINKTWTPPAKPADCELDWGNGMFVDRGEAGITCTGDTVIGSATSTLEYGRGYRSGSVECTSASTGLTCKDLTTGRGFTLAAARYRLF